MVFIRETRPASSIGIPISTVNEPFLTTRDDSFYLDPSPATFTKPLAFFSALAGSRVLVLK